MSTVPVRKPGRQVWFRVHPDPGYWAKDVGLIQLKDDNEFFLIDPSLATELEEFYQPYTLYTATTRNGAIFLWPVRTLGPDGKNNDCWRSAHEAAALSTTERWTRISANRSLGAYDVHFANGIKVEPKWPEKSLSELLKIAFKADDHFITSVDHILVENLRGWK